ADNRPTSDDTAREKLSKTGGTPYIARKIDIAMDDGLMLPASALNGLRRDALSALSQERRRRNPVSLDWREESIPPHIAGEQELHIVLHSLSQMPRSIHPAVRRVYLPLEAERDALARAVESLHEQGVEAAVEAPRGIFGQESFLRGRMTDAAGMGISVCMVHNVGLIEPAISAGLAPYGGFGLNITNTYALEALRELSLCGAELSYELTLGQIEKLGGSMPRGLCIYGRQALMLTRNCPAKLSGRCNPSQGGCSITDRFGADFPVACRLGCSEVFNSIPLSIVDKKSEIGSITHLLARFTVENSVETEEKLIEIAENYPRSNKGFTKGLYYRGVE
ncbi:MAG: DUF3656 domain-containing protein, partial [Clostridia bacterium]|nr:DUF3656 domain-containing protein [Clostridia bacterium]